MSEDNNNLNENTKPKEQDFHFQSADNKMQSKEDALTGSSLEVSESEILKDTTTTDEQEADNLQKTDELEKDKSKPNDSVAKEYRKIEIYEMILEDIVENSEICVFSDPEEMNEFYIALVCLKNRCGLSGEPCFAEKDGNEGGVSNSEGEALSNKIINFCKEVDSTPKENFKKDKRSSFVKRKVAEILNFKANERLIIDQNYLARRRSCLERLGKIVFLKISLSEDFEMRIAFNRDSDLTNFIHRSRVLDQKLNFFFQQLKRLKRMVITGSSEGIMEFVGRCINQPYVAKKDPTGHFTFIELTDSSSD